MAGFHMLGDPYFPNQGNGGWIEEDPEEDPEELVEAEEAEDGRSQKRSQIQSGRLLTLFTSPGFPHTD